MPTNGFSGILDSVTTTLKKYTLKGGGGLLEGTGDRYIQILSKQNNDNIFTLFSICPTSESVEFVIEAQAFLRTYDLAPSLPSSRPPFRQQVVTLSHSSFYVASRAY